MKQIKFLLIYLLIANAVPGLWALFFPHNFFSNFPNLGLGLHWIDTMGPFNDHFIRDIGAFFCALAFLSAYTLTRMEEGTIRLTAYTNIVFALTHLIYHLMMINMFVTMTDKVLGLGSLTFAVIVPIVILLKTKNGFSKVTS